METLVQLVQAAARGAVKRIAFGLTEVGFVRLRVEGRIRRLHQAQHRLNPVRDQTFQSPMYQKIEGTNTRVETKR